MNEPLPGDPTCPACKSQLEGYTDSGDGSAHPGNGAISFCVYCLNVGIFVTDVDGNFTIRDATVEELVELEKDHEYRQARLITAEINRQMQELT